MAFPQLSTHRLVVIDGPQLPDAHDQSEKPKKEAFERQDDPKYCCGGRRHEAATICKTEDFCFSVCGGAARGGDNPTFPFTAQTDVEIVQGDVDAVTTGEKDVKLEEERTR